MAATPHARHARTREQYVKQLIRKRYTGIANADPTSTGGHERARQDGYPAAHLAALPRNTVARYSGCGYALEDLNLRGMRVIVDLGCGAGLDACLIAACLDAGARVVALDLTHAMLERVRETARELSRTGIQPVAGDMERLPLRDAIADVVLANASFNLTLNAQAAFAEAARILRPGGQLIARELVREQVLPAELATDPLGWNASLGGVPEEATLREMLLSAGFEDVRIVDHRPFAPVTSVRLRARRRYDHQQITPASSLVQSTANCRSAVTVDRF
ncbi:MAG: methyltransferase domain-containing protein [Gammaproteobacteria bacterium]|nr:methyltransferase domain-containing protein [Gammaproteobacteria bacterium]